MDSGKLLVEIVLADGRIATVRARSTRPAAARVLVGRTPAAALALIPWLFSLCGRAQAAVAAAAIGHAEGAAGRPDNRALRLEAVQEHLWRVLLDWPSALGLPPLAAPFAVWHKRLTTAGRGGAEADPALPDELADFLAAEVFGTAPSAWAAGDDAAVPALADRLLPPLATAAPAPPLPPLLPGLNAAEWTDILAGAPPDFARQPRWQGTTAETGGLARHAAHPRVAGLWRSGATVAARLACRLLDLAAAPALLAAAAPIDAASPTPGWGVAAADTARGQLVHSVRIADGRIADYVVIAPTEWNFPTPGGGLAELCGRPAADAAAARTLAHRQVLALDPCVPFAIEIATETVHA